MANEWIDRGNGPRELAMIISKDGYSGFIYGDDPHTDSASSELAFAAIKNETTFENSFEFEYPDWIESVSAVNHEADGNYKCLRFTVRPQVEGAAERSGNIVIKYQNNQLILKVTQEKYDSVTPPAPTGYTLYMNSDKSFNSILTAVKVNGSSVTIPTTKSIKIFTSAAPPITNPSPINIEIQPLLPSSSSITFYLSFNTNNTYNNNNIVYNDFSGEPSPLPSGLSAFKYLTSNNTVQIKVDRNNSIWEDMVDDVSCGQKFYNPADAIYPTINIYISNRLSLVSWELNYIFYNNTDFQINEIVVKIATPDIYGTVDSLENNGTQINPYDQYGSSTPISIKRSEMNTLFSLDPGNNGKGYITLHVEAATGTKPVDEIDVYCRPYRYSQNYLDPFYIYIQ